MKKKIILVVAICFGMMSCNSSGNANENNSNVSVANTQSDEDESDDDYIGDDQNRSYPLGTITFATEGKTHTIEKFGIDPYTAMTWFTPESGVEPMANVVFKSDDFKKTAMVNIQDFDAMQTTYQGTKEIKNSQPIVSFVEGDNTYMVSEGTLTVEDFSRKTGKIKLKVIGKWNKSVLTDPSAMKMDIDATLEMDAYIPFASIDGAFSKTEAADKFKVQKP